MSSNSSSHSQEFNISSHQQQSLVEDPINPSTQSDPLVKPAPDPDQETPLEKEEDFEAVAKDLVNPGMTHSHSFVPAEVSVGPSVSSASDSMLTSPTYNSRRLHWRKKGKTRGGVKRQKEIEMKLQTLSERLKLVPFVPSKTLDFDKHELLFKRLGLWDFVNIGLCSDFSNFRTDLVAQLVATYDAKSRCSYVNDVRIKVNRTDLARAFKLPLKKERTGKPLASDVGEFDLTVSEDSVAFLEQFVSRWMILNNNEELWIMPDELVNLTKPIKDGHPEKMDWPTLLWFMVEQELLLGGQLVNCNYASHLQHLIRSQREQLLSTEPVEVVMTQEADTGLQERETDELFFMEVPKIGETCLEVQEKKDDGYEEEAMEEKGQDKEEEVLKKNNDGDKEEVLEKARDKEEVPETMDSVKEEVPEKKSDGKEEVLEKKEDGDEKEVLKKGQDKNEEVLETNDDLKEEEVLEKKDDSKEEEVLEKKDDGKEDEVLDKKEDGKGEEVPETDGDGKEEELLEKKYDGEEEAVLEKKDYCNETTSKADELGKALEEENNVMGEPRIELTLGQEFTIGEVPEDVDMVDFEFNYVHVEQDQGQWLLNGKNSVGEHFLQRCGMRENRGSDGIEKKIEEVDDMEEEVEVEDGFGLAGNFQGAMAADKLAYVSQGPLSDRPSVNLMDSQNELEHIDASGPSFYSGNGKRKIQDDIDVSHHVLHSGNKRLRTEDSSDHQLGDFGTCMDEIQLLMDRTRTLYMEKMQDEEQSNVNQQILLNELQKRDGVIEHLDQMKQEEIRKRDVEIYRLKRELFLMCSLLEDYKKAIRQTGKAFSEYRLQYEHLEEPIYKDAGPGGLVLSITDIEKRRHSDAKEFRVKCLDIEQKAKEAEEAYTFQFGEFLDKVDRLDKRLSVFENEFRSLKSHVLND